jgi:hypothetical protein
MAEIQRLWHGRDPEIMVWQRFRDYGIAEIQRLWYGRDSEIMA